MRILFIDQFSDMGGAQSCLLDLLPAVQARGWSAHFALPGAGDLIDRVKRAGATVDSISCGTYGIGRKSVSDAFRFACNVPILAKQISRIADAYAIDLIYVNGPRVLPAAALAARRRRLLFHCHLFLKPGYAARLAGESIRLSRAEVVLACRFFAQALRPYVRADRVNVVYTGIAPIPAAARGFRQDGPWRIGLIGRIAPQKGQAEFLEAARLLCSRIQNCAFMICGAPLFSDPPAQRYFKTLRKSAVGLPVEFTGWQEDVGLVLSKLDILVVPSLVEEGIPRVILEAFAAGVPVVAFPAGGIPEVVAHERSGFLVTPETPQALAEALGALMMAPGKLRTAADAGRDAWIRRFTLPRYQADIMALMERAAS